MREVKRKPEKRTGDDDINQLLEIKKQKFDWQKKVLELQAENLLMQNLKLQLELREKYNVETQLIHTPYVQRNEQWNT